MNSSFGFRHVGTLIVALMLISTLIVFQFPLWFEVFGWIAAIGVAWLAYTYGD
jgi:hypothetical protein